VMAMPHTVAGHRIARVEQESATCPQHGPNRSQERFSV
jgi:hypothetical protein